MRYFITFACYGAHLHGDESGSVDRHHNVFGNRVLQADPLRAGHERTRMTDPPYLLDTAARATVLRSLQDVCAYRGWSLIGAHVRMNHIHVIAESDARPEKMMSDFKVYASRELNRLLPEESNRKRWARHGSTRWLWSDEDVADALRYVIEEQGEVMAVFIQDS